MDSKTVVGYSLLYISAKIPWQHSEKRGKPSGPSGQQVRGRWQHPDGQGVDPHAVVCSQGGVVCTGTAFKFHHGAVAIVPKVPRPQAHVQDVHQHGRLRWADPEAYGALFQCL